MRIRAITSAVVLAGAALAALPMAAARAATTTPAATTASAGGVALPLHSYLQMAVDSAHDHLFFSQGNPAENGILVTDFSGRTVTTIDHQTGVMGITLSPDGKTLYAALSGLHEVSAISTATLRQTAVYPLGDANTPVFVALQSGKLLVSYDTSALGWDGAVGDFNLSAANPTLQPFAGNGSLYAAPLIAADPADRGNVLVTMQPDMAPAGTTSYDTATDPPRVRSSAWGIFMKDGYDCSDVQDVAVVPGGGQFIPACDQQITPNTLFSTGNLSAGRSYPTPEYSDAIAFATGTGLVATGVNGSLPDVLVYAPGSSTPLDTLSAGSYGLAPRGLGLTADGSKLFALAMDAPMVIGPGESENPGVTLYTYDLTARHQPSLTLSASPAAATYRPVVHLSVRLGATSGNRTVSVYARTAGSAKLIRLKTGSVTSAGALTLSYPAAHTTTFSAVYPGDAHDLGRTVTTTVTVTARVTAKLSGYYATTRIGGVTYRLYHQTGRLADAIAVAPGKPGRCVRLQAQYQSKGAWHPAVTSGCLTLGKSSAATGRLALGKDHPGYPYRVRVDYSRGNDVSNLSADSGWQFFKV